MDSERTRIASQVALAMEHLALARGITRGLIHVVPDLNEHRPLALTTLGNQGWGHNMLGPGEHPQDHIDVAIKSAQYAIAGKRSATDQGEYEVEKNRTPASYGKLRDLYMGRSVYFKAGVVATLVTDQLTGGDSEKLANQAAEMVMDRETTFNVSEASTVLGIIKSEFEAHPNRFPSGLILLTQSMYRLQEDPVLVGVRTVGPFENSLHFVVAAKARASAATNLPSGPELADIPDVRHVSRIEGAVPLQVGSRLDRRIIAVGGLRPTDGNPRPDSELIKEVVRRRLGQAALGLAD